MAHPRANDQAERANGMILDALKKHLYEKEEKHPRRWVQELPIVVWGLRTQTSRSIGVSPYYLVYGSEAVLPKDVAFRSPRVEQYAEQVSDQTCSEDVNCLEEERLATCIQSAKYLKGVHHYYDRNVKERPFAVGDLVLRRKQNTSSMRKLSSPWEGPFIVETVTRPGSYRLVNADGTDIPNSWHAEHLIHFYA